jgi:predicted nucleic acid-binding protein
VPQQAYARIAAIDEQFADLRLGVVDAALIVLAESLHVPRIATADRRHCEPSASAFRLELVP